MKRWQRIGSESGRDHVSVKQHPEYQTHVGYGPIGYAVVLSLKRPGLYHFWKPHAVTLANVQRQKP